MVNQRIYYQSGFGARDFNLCDEKVDESQTPAGINVAWLIPITAVIVTLCYFVVVPIDLPLVAHLKPALSVSLSHFLLGLVCIVSQRNIVKQVFGYCLMENGSHLTLALLANKAPELVEIGIATDAIFARHHNGGVGKQNLPYIPLIRCKTTYEFEGVTLCMNNG